MRWAFWKADDRRDSGGSDIDKVSEAPDAAAELRARTRRRLIGAAVLLLGAIIVLPVLLDSTPRPVPRNVAITAPPPAAAIGANGAAPTADEKKPAMPAEPPPAEPAPPKPVPGPVEAPVHAASKAAPLAEAKVEKRAEPAAANVSGGVAPGEKFALQVAALSSADAAKELAARLKKGGFSAYIVPVSTAKGTRFRVRVGPFASREEAQKAAEKLKSERFSAEVVAS